MRFEAVRAGAFGALVDQRLELAPGMNIIHGPNEAAKSTWHAAMYAALCGLRRARGATRREDREFTDRHRPWDRGDWWVEAIVILDGGRRVDLHQDLAGGVGCRATDLDLGRDISDEIMNEGTPDGAKFLGLDRASFAAIACVQQAEILAVLNSAEDLQEHLQRAAASPGSDTTAAMALERLDVFRRERVGLDRANSTKPLRVAIVRLEHARRAVDAAIEAHSRYDLSAQDAAELAARASGARQRVRIVEAALAAGQARVALDRAIRVKELANLSPTEPPSRADDDSLAQQVATAIAAYEQRPEVLSPPSISSAELRAQLARLPVVPEGDLTPDPAIERARRSYDEARRDQRLQSNARPSDPITPESGGFESDGLRRLATELARPVPTLDSLIKQRVDTAAARLDAASHQRRTAQTRLTIGAALVVLGAIGMIALTPVLGAVTVVGLVLGIQAVLAFRAVRPATVNAELEQARGAIAEQQRIVDEDAQQRRALIERLKKVGLPADAGTLSTLADTLGTAQQQRDALAQWQRRDKDLEGVVGHTREELVHALEARGIVVEGSVEEAVDEYVRACNDRTRDAVAAARRTDLENQLSACMTLEQSMADTLVAREGAETSVRVVAIACGIGSDRPAEDLLTELRQWKQARTEEVAEHEAARQAWTELQTLLAGQSITEVDDGGARAERGAATLAEGLDSDTLARYLGANDLDEQLVQARSEGDDATSAARHAAGALESIAAALPDAAEADEELAAATAEFERVKELDKTLATTIEFLTRAQDAVHRDVAQVLARPVRERLSAITGDRYHDVVIDPETLSVQVRNAAGKLRNAAWLSHGTAEQIYLLLRVAMAERLTDGESCPLLLDDVTAQTDPERTPHVLDLLHSLSERHQIVLFSQEDDVAAWANAHLTGVNDKLIELDPSLIAP